MSSTELAPDVDVELVSRLGDQLLRLQRRRSTVYDGARLDNSAFRILWVLSDGEPRTMRELADQLELEQSTVNRQVHAALDAGLVERIECGRPAKQLRPTAAGAEAYEHDGMLRVSLIGAALAALGPRRAQALVRDLEVFNDAWDAALRSSG